MPSDAKWLPVVCLPRPDSTLVVQVIEAPAERIYLLLLRYRQFSSGHFATRVVMPPYACLWGRLAPPFQLFPVIKKRIRQHGIFAHHTVARAVPINGMSGTEITAYKTMPKRLNVRM
jgi:hypothetical protein